MTTPKGPPGHWLTGHLAEFRADRLGFFTRCARTYGDVVPLRIGRYRILLVSDPDLIEQVLVTDAGKFIKHFGLRLYKPLLGQGLVTSEGNFWRRQRKLAAPAFQGARLGVYADEMVACTLRMLEQWRGFEDESAMRSGIGRRAGTNDGSGPPESLAVSRPEAPKRRPNVAAAAGVARDIHADLMRLTLDIACRTLFGADACPNPELVGRAMEHGMEAIGDRLSWLLPLPDWFPTPSNLKLRRSLTDLDNVVTGIIARRRTAGVGAGGRTGGGNGAGMGTQTADGNGAGEGAVESGPIDLLSTFLAARDEEGSGMTHRQMLDEVRTILLAGHETTALALTYALHLLSTHPAAQAKLHVELSDVLNGRPPAYAELPRLTYTRNVVTEALRLYPPADFLGREATADCTIGDVRVPRGTNVFFSQWVMHRDGRYFSDPESFDPDRWTPAFEESLPRYAYFPFGGGPRYCIGQTFATTEAALVLAAICQRFEFSPQPGFRLELWPNITLRPRAGVTLVVRDR